MKIPDYANKYFRKDGFIKYLKNFSYIFLIFCGLIGLFVGVLLFLITESFYGILIGFVACFFGTILLSVFLFVFDFISRYFIYHKYGDFSFSLSIVDNFNVVPSWLGSVRDIKSLIKLEPKFKKANFQIEGNRITLITKASAWKSSDEITIELNMNEQGRYILITSKPSKKLALFDHGSNYENVEIIKRNLRTVVGSGPGTGHGLPGLHHRP